MSYNTASAGNGQIGRIKHGSKAKIPAAQLAAGIFYCKSFDQ
jgi:hypothetical protein